MRGARVCQLSDIFTCGQPTKYTLIKDAHHPSYETAMDDLMIINCRSSAKYGIRILILRRLTRNCEENPERKKPMPLSLQHNCEGRKHVFDDGSSALKNVALSQALEQG